MADDRLAARIEQRRMQIGRLNQSLRSCAGAAAVGKPQQQRHSGQLGVERVVASADSAMLA